MVRGVAGPAARIVGTRAGTRARPMVLREGSAMPIEPGTRPGARPGTLLHTAHPGLAVRNVAMVAAGISRFGNSTADTPKRLVDEAWAELRTRAPKWDGHADEAWVGTVGFGGNQPGNSAALFLQGTPSQGIAARRVENA